MTQPPEGGSNRPPSDHPYPGSPGHGTPYGAAGADEPTWQAPAQPAGPEPTWQAPAQPAGPEPTWQMPAQPGGGQQWQSSGGEQTWQVPAQPGGTDPTQQISGPPASAPPAPGQWSTPAQPGQPAPAYPGQPVSGQPAPEGYGAPGAPGFPPPAPPKKRRGLLIVTIVLAVALLLCAGGGTAAFFVLRDAESGEGAAQPTAAVEAFLKAVYTEKDAAKAAAVVCSAARDEEAISRKVQEVRDYDKKYKNPRFRWTAPKVEGQQQDKATVSVKLTMSTADEKSADQQLKFTVIKETGWWVCEVA